jgi:hypothetical protein
MASGARELAEKIVSYTDNCGEVDPGNWPELESFVLARDTELTRLARAQVILEVAEHFPQWDREVWGLGCSCGWKCPAQCNEREYRGVFKLGNYILDNFGG